MSQVAASTLGTCAALLENALKSFRRVDMLNSVFGHAMLQFGEILRLVLSIIVTVMSLMMSFQCHFYKDESDKLTLQLLISARHG